MSFDAVFAGYPTGMASPSAAPAFGVDTTNFNGYLNSKTGWVPFAPSTVAKAVSLGAVANNANLLTYAAPVTGLYKVDFYETSANAPTGATLPALTIAYTDGDTAGSITSTLASASASAANVVNQGTFLINAAAASNIVLATTSYAAGSGTALAFNVKVRITYLG